MGAHHASLVWDAARRFGEEYVGGQEELKQKRKQANSWMVECSDIEVRVLLSSLKPVLVKTIRSLAKLQEDGLPAPVLFCILPARLPA